MKEKFLYTKNLLQLYTPLLALFLYQCLHFVQYNAVLLDVAEEINIFDIFWIFL